MINDASEVVTLLGNSNVQHFVDKMGQHVASLKELASKGPRGFAGALPNGTLPEENSATIKLGYFISTFPILFSKWYI